MGILEKVFGKKQRTDEVKTTFGTIEMTVPGSNYIMEWFEANKDRMIDMDGWYGAALLLRDFSTTPEFNNFSNDNMLSFAEELKKNMTPGDMKNIFSYWYKLHGTTVEELNKMSQSEDFRLKK